MDTQGAHKQKKDHNRAVGVYLLAMFTNETPTHYNQKKNNKQRSFVHGKQYVFNVTGGGR